VRRKGTVNDEVVGKEMSGPALVWVREPRHNLDLQGTDVGLIYLSENRTNRSKNGSYV